MNESTYQDRVAAGQALAQKLGYVSLPPDTLVLGLPRGGVPVAWEVAQALHFELDILNLRKLGLPHQPEVAMGAIAEDGTRYLDQELIDRLGVSPEQISRVEEREKATLESRIRRFRDVRQQTVATGLTVILVDDGLATGATMELAVQVMRKRRAGRIIVAVPVGPTGTTEHFSKVADQCVCLLEPRTFNSVGLWYRDFDQVSEEEVMRILEQSRPESPESPES